MTKGLYKRFSAKQSAGAIVEKFAGCQIEDPIQEPQHLS